MLSEALRQMFAGYRIVEVGEPVTEGKVVGYYDCPTGRTLLRYFAPGDSEGVDVLAFSDPQLVALVLTCDSEITLDWNEFRNTINRRKLECRG